MADISKRLEKAEKYLQKGKQNDALEEYLQILEDDPNNDAIKQQAADLCMTLGRNNDAAVLLGELFDKQASVGDQVKAVANYKKLARLGTPTVDQTFKFSQFIEKSDKKQALEGYNFSVNSFLAADRREEALAVYKRIVLIDSNATSHKALGELAETLHDNKAAGASFLKMAEFESHNALNWLERGYSLDKTNPALVLEYGRALLGASQAEKSLHVLEPMAKAPDSSPDFREAYARALLAENRVADAEPYVFQLFEKDPNKAEEVAGLVATLLKQENQDKALQVTEKLEHAMTKLNKRREFIGMMKDVVAMCPPGPSFLEYMVALYNSANRESDYCETLISLFQLHFANGQFLKAADCLDRITEVDPYHAGNAKRLEMLTGKIDAQRYNAIAGRLQTVGAIADQSADKAKADQALDKEPTMLEDFLLQAEIFLQYGMRSKAMERIERIHKLFPHEEEKNEKLHALYNNAGFVPKYDAASKPPASAPAGAAPLSAFGAAPSYGGGGGAPAAPPPVIATASSDETAVDNFARVTEITRNIYRQSTVKGVLFTAVNDVGRHYGVSRCIAGLCTPGKPPSAALEYCAPGIKQSEVQHIVKLLGAVQSFSVSAGMVTLDDVLKAPQLSAIKDSLVALGIKSLLAAPLMDPGAEEHTGVLLLEQCDQVRRWRSTDAVVLKTIADQMVLAVNNAKLRSLMKNLAVTDEKSGLLKRSSYLDVLLSEAKRALSQNSTASVLLFHFGKPSVLVKELGEPAVEGLMQQVGQTICSQIRQNDVAVRYDMTTIALILPDTTDKNSFFVVDKMRKVLTGFKVAGTERALQITVGIAEAVMQSQYEPIDIITEVINRAEAALEAAKTEGANTAKSLAPQVATAAVA